MKKIIIVLFAALMVSIQANAQITPKLSFMTSNEIIRVNENGRWVPENAINYAGFSVGADYSIELPWVDGLAAMPGLYFNFLFAGRDVQQINDVYTDIALQIPAYVSYTYRFNRTVAVLGYGGPSFQLGLVKTGIFKNGGGRDVITNFYSKEAGNATYSRAMLLLGLGAGVELFQHLQLTTGIDFGITRFYGDKLFRASRPFQVKFSVGYAF